MRLASVGLFKGWNDWNKVERYPKTRKAIVTAAEALLIFAHQPAYNSSGLVTLKKAVGIRVFNTGKIGHLLPEISYLYYQE